MKNKANPEESTPAQGTIDGPGAQLRKARERQGLEQTKMAAQLHLSQAMIQALEWDDYEKLPSPVFVQGYLRNYSRLLGVNEDAVIQAYQALNPSLEQAPLPRNQPDEVAKELHSDHHIVRFVTWTVVVLLGVLLFFWWQGRMDLPQPGPQESTEESSALTPGFPAPDPLESEPAPADLSSLPAATEEETQPSGFEAPADTLQPAPEPALMPELSISIPEEPAASDEPTQAPGTDEPVQPMETTEAPAEEASPAMPAGTLVFEFSGPCWVEVRDPTGRARIIGEMRSGVRRTLNAQLGPYNVVIGDVNAASLTINGTAYDLSRHARGKVARFTLDPSQM